jgi:flagellar biogenesis protein FliO
MSRFVVGLLAGSLLLAAAAVVHAVEPAELLRMNLLDNITGDPDHGCALTMAIRDRAGLSDATVETKGREVHITLPRAFIHPPMRAFGSLGGNACFARAVAAQVDKHTVRVVASLRDAYKGETVFHLKHDGDQLRVVLGEAPPAPAKAENPPPEAKIDLAALLASTSPPATPETPPAAAPSPPAEQRAAAPPPAADFDWTAAGLKMGAALAVTLGAVFLMAGLAKRLRLPARLTGGRGGTIRVVQSAMLDMKHRVAVVDVAGELIVVAIAGGNVTMLTKIESDEARRRLLGEPDEAGARAPAPAPEAAFAFGEPAGREIPATDFGARLRAYTRHASKESAVAGQETLQAIADRVKGLKRL